MLREITFIDFYGFYFKNILNKQAKTLTNSKGVLSGPVYFLFRSYSKLLKEFKNIIFCIDHTVYNYRKEVYSDYKGNRDDAKNKYIDEGIDIGTYKSEFMLSIPNFYCFHHHLEADDIIYSLVKILRNNYGYKIKVNIITNDHDLWRLKDDNTFIFNFKYEEITYDTIKDKYKLEDPDNILWYKIIFGDTSDNIPSVVPKGTRKKKFIEFLNNNKFEDITVEKLINEFDVIDKFNIYRNLNLVNFIFRDDIRIRYFEGDEIKFNEVVSKYDFSKISSFNEYKTLFLNANYEMIDNKSDVL